MPAARREGRGLFERSPEPEEERDDQAPDEQGHAPAPGRHRGWRERLIQQHAQERGEHHGRLLAGRLPADIEALVAGRRDLREIDRHAAELHAC
jgi:hypothetical protein